LENLVPEELVPVTKNDEIDKLLKTENSKKKIKKDDENTNDISENDKSSNDILENGNSSNDIVTTDISQNAANQKLENEATENDNSKGDILEEDNRPKCVDFDATTFGKDNSSIFVIRAEGRVGNHLMAYTLIKAFQAKLKIQVRGRH